MRIIFYCGPSWAPWSPASASAGLSGSQEAVCELARRLAGEDHDVTVYNDCGGAAGLHDGVEYRPHDKVAGDSDVLVIWRHPQLLENTARLHARLRYLWLQDLIPEPAVLAQQTRFDKLIVLSRFHRSHYARLPDERIFRSRNGIDRAHFEITVARNPQKVVYGSNYNRGLATLLRLWPRVRSAVPGASLNVFYGWQTLRAYSRRPTQGWRAYLRANPLAFVLFRCHIERRLHQPGVNHLGRIGHAEVARQFCSAGVWAYPSRYPETSCITAMKAQAGGAIPVVLASGALGETVRHGFRLAVENGKRVERAWLDLLIETLRHWDRQERIRAAMREDACHYFSWERIAAEWAAEFDFPARH